MADTLADVISSLSNGDIQEYIRMDSGSNQGDSAQEHLPDLTDVLDEAYGSFGEDMLSCGQVSGSECNDRSPERNSGFHMPESNKTEQESVIHRLFRTLQRSSGRYLSDVFQCDTQTEAERFCRSVRDDALNGYRGGFFIVVRDGTHCHVIHVCNFNSGTCRCSFIQKAKSRAELRRPVSQHRRKYANKLSKEDISRILFYFASKGRKPEDIFFICGRVEGLSSEDFLVPLEEYKKSTGGEEQHSLETRFTIPDIELLTPEQIRDSTEEIHRARNKRDIVKGKGGKAEIQRRIITLCQENPSSPIASIINKKEWISDPIFSLCVMIIS